MVVRRVPICDTQGVSGISAYLAVGALTADFISIPT